MADFQEELPQGQPKEQKQKPNQDTWDLERVRGSHGGRGRLVTVYYDQRNDTPRTQVMIVNFDYARSLLSEGAGKARSTTSLKAIQAVGKDADTKLPHHRVFAIEIDKPNQGKQLIDIGIDKRTGRLSLYRGNENIEISSQERNEIEAILKATNGILAASRAESPKEAWNIMAQSQIDYLEPNIMPPQEDTSQTPKQVETRKTTIDELRSLQSACQQLLCE